MMRNALLALIGFYRKHLSGLKSAPTCRFTPTCSEYALQAVQKYGVWKGGWLAIKRLGRCQPFSKRDYFDPVP